MVFPSWEHLKKLSDIFMFAQVTSTKQEQWTTYWVDLDDMMLTLRENQRGPPLSTFFIAYYIIKPNLEDKIRFNSIDIVGNHHICQGKLMTIATSSSFEIVEFIRRFNNMNQQWKARVNQSNAKSCQISIKSNGFFSFQKQCDISPTGISIKGTINNQEIPIDKIQRFAPIFNPEKGSGLFEFKMKENDEITEQKCSVEVMGQLFETFFTNLYIASAK